MRVLIITPYYYPYLGGLENYARHIAVGLAKSGHQVSIITSNQESRKTETTLIDGITIYRLPYLVTIFNTPVSPFWRYKLRKLINELKPDVINAHTPVPYMADLVERVRGRVPFILTYHNDLAKEPFLLSQLAKLEYIVLTNKTIRRASGIIVTSQKYLDNSRYLNSYREKCDIVSPGVDTALYKPQQNVSNTKTVIFVGQLHRNHSHKGLNVLIDAMIKITAKNVRLLIVGSGDGLTMYRDQIAQLGLTDVVFAGRLSDEELARSYRESSVLVLPATSSAEGFGMVILEAAASGVPSIGSNIGGISEAIINGRTGLLVPPNDAIALASALDTILLDDTLQNDLGRNAHARAVADFKWAKQINKTETILYRAAGIGK